MDVESRIINIVVEKLGKDKSEITPDKNFTTDLNADSLDTVELIMELEKEFDITIEDSEAESLKTVGDAYDYIKAKIAAKEKASK